MHQQAQILSQSHNLAQQQQINLQQQQAALQQQHNLHNLQMQKPDILTVQNVNQNYNSNNNLNKSNSNNDRLMALVNVAAAQQSLAVPEKLNETKKVGQKQQQQLNSKTSNKIENQSINQLNLISQINQVNQQIANPHHQGKSSIKMPQNLISKEKFEKEFRQQEQSTKQSVPPVVNVNMDTNTSSSLNLSKIDLKQNKKEISPDTDGSQIFSESFKSEKPISKEKFIESIIRHQINQVDISSNRPGNLPKKLKQEPVNPLTSLNNQAKIQEDAKLNISDSNKEDSSKKLDNKQQQKNNQISEFGVSLPQFGYSAFANASKKLNEKQQSSNNSSESNKTNKEIVDLISSKTVEHPSKNLMNTIPFDYVGNKIFETMKKESNEKEITSSSSNTSSSFQKIVNTTANTNPITTSITSTISNITSKPTEKLRGPSMPLLVSNKKPVKSKEDEKKFEPNKSSLNNKIINSTDDLKRDKSTIALSSSSLSAETINKRTIEKIDKTDELINSNKKLKSEDANKSTEKESNEIFNRKLINAYLEPKQSLNKDVNNLAAEELKKDEQIDHENPTTSIMPSTTANVTNSNKTEPITSTVDSTTNSEPSLKTDDKFEVDNNSKPKENYSNALDLDSNLYSPCTPDTPGEMVIDESVNSPISSAPQSPIQSQTTTVTKQQKETDLETLSTSITSSSTASLASTFNKNTNLPFSSTELELNNFNEKQSIDKTNEKELIENNLSSSNSTFKENDFKLPENLCSNKEALKEEKNLEKVNDKDGAIKKDKIDDTKESAVITSSNLKEN